MFEYFVQEGRNMSKLIQLNTGEWIPLLWVPPGGERRRARKSEMTTEQCEAMRIHEREYEATRRARGKRKGVFDGETANTGS